MVQRAINFGAGPSALPESVLEEAGKGLLDFEGTGIGVAEISHRSEQFKNYLRTMEADMRKLLAIPDSHAVLFTQGGGCGQFSDVVLNLLARHYLQYPGVTPEKRALDYVVTGSWSKKAKDEARRLVGGRGTVRVVANAQDYSAQRRFDCVPPHSAYQFSADPVLVYYCANETVDGVEFARDGESPSAFPFESLPSNTPLVGDYSSSFMSHPIPHLAKHAVVFAGAQKNLGPAGLTVLIVRKDCLVDVDAAAQAGAIPVPLCSAYRTLEANGSLYNTPPVLPIYVAGLVVRRMLNELGEDAVKQYADMSTEKAALVYEAMEHGEQQGVFKSKVEKGSSSRMNVVFDVLGEGKLNLFIKGAEERNMKGLRGHR